MNTQPSRPMSPAAKPYETSKAPRSPSISMQRVEQEEEMGNEACRRAADRYQAAGGKPNPTDKDRLKNKK